MAPFGKSFWLECKILVFGIYCSSQKWYNFWLEHWIPNTTPMLFPNGAYTYDQMGSEDRMLNGSTVSCNKKQQLFRVSYQVKPSRKDAATLVVKNVNVLSSASQQAYLKENFQEI